MPEISISEDQRERLEGVRSDVEDAFVDTYGHTRLEDAVEYLLDTYTPPDESESDGAYERIATATYSELQHVAGDVPEVPGSGLDADEMRGKLLAELGTEEFAARLGATGTNEEGETERETELTANEESEDGETESTVDEESEDSETESTVDEESEDDEVGPNIGTVAAGSGPSGESLGSGSVVRVGTGDADEADDSPASSEEEPEETAAAGNPVAAANQLLRDHDDKWRESGGDAPYEVDLPDGTTASARTKDDVRQLLFRHY